MIYGYGLLVVGYRFMGLVLTHNLIPSTNNHLHFLRTKWDIFYALAYFLQSRFALCASGKPMMFFIVFFQVWATVLSENLFSRKTDDNNCKGCTKCRLEKKKAMKRFFSIIIAHEKVYFCLSPWRGWKPSAKKVMIWAQEFPEELAHREILALITSGAECTHTLQGVYLCFCKK